MLLPHGVLAEDGGGQDLDPQTGGCVQAAGLDWGWAWLGPWSLHRSPTPAPRLSSQKYQNEFNTNVAMAEIYKYAKRYRRR